MVPETVILDVDPGHDDAVALMLACGAPELEVRAVTTVAGNAPLPKTTLNTLKVLSHVGRAGIPVGVGAAAPLVGALRTAEHVHGESGLDGADLPDPSLTPDARGAARLMADVLGEATGPVTLIPLGPLTNVATFLGEYPDLREKVRRVVLMGGSIGPGNVTPAAEFNVYVDPEAARVVFGSGLPITMVGLDATRQATVGGEEAGGLRSLGRAGELAAGLVTFRTEEYARTRGSVPEPLHDPVAVAAVVDPSILRTRRMRVDVECEGALTRGETVCDVYGVTGKEPNADVGVGLEKGAFFEVLYRSIGTL